MSKYAKKKNYLNDIKIAAIYILIVVLAVMVTAVSQRVKYEKQIAEINVNHEEAMSALRTELQDEYEARMSELELYYEYGGDVDQIDQEAEWIAKVMYGMDRPGHNDSDRRAVVWCVLNRVDNNAYANNIQEVCQQKNQWIGYSDDNLVIANLYDIALAELKNWYNGAPRQTSTDYVYLTWSSEEILLRDTFEENKSTHYWRMR